VRRTNKCGSALRKAARNGSGGTLQVSDGFLRLIDEPIKAVYPWFDWLFFPWLYELIKAVSHISSPHYALGGTLSKYFIELPYCLW
jgi:hypothetical protein